MKTTKYYLIFLLTVLFGACTGGDESSGMNGYEEPDDYGQTYSLSGSVTINGEPVNAAAVLLTPGGGTFLTGSDGIFIFDEVPSGTYEIKVYKEGCQPFNKSLKIDRNYTDMALTVTENKGNLQLNKGYIDMGSNSGNNVAAFTITNKGERELAWQATWGARWITKMEPSKGTIPAGGSAAVSFTINRDRLSSETFDNHTGIVVQSTTDADGSVGEILVTAFGQGSGTNVVNDNSDLDYVMVGDLYVQTVDISESRLNRESAILLCGNSIKGGYNDWRLPTLDELATMYENRAAIGGFANGDYWASDYNPNNSWHYYCMNFSSGEVKNYQFNDPRRVRAVRKDPVDHLPVVTTLDYTTSGNSIVLNGNIEDEGLPKYTERGFIVSTQPIPTLNNGTKYVVEGHATSEFKYGLDDLQIGKTYYYVAYATNELGTAYGEPKSYTHQHTLYVYIPDLHLMVQRQDLGNTSEYTLADNLCIQSKVGEFSDWRLPTIDELVAIAKYTDSYNLNFKNTSSSYSCYWSSTMSSTGSHFLFDFYYNKTRITDSPKSYYPYVRAVRTANL